MITGSDTGLKKIIFYTIESTDRVQTLNFRQYNVLFRNVKLRQNTEVRLTAKAIGIIVLTSGEQ